MTLIYNCGGVCATLTARAGDLSSVLQSPFPSRVYKSEFKMVQTSMYEEYEEREYRMFHQQLNNEKWDLDAPHTALLQFVDFLAPHPNALTNTQSTIFIPCCGRSLDLHAIWDYDYNVISCEADVDAFTDIFKEMKKVPVVGTEMQGGVEITTHSIERMKIYQCKLEQLVDIGKIDGVFDSTSLVYTPLQEKYNYAQKIIKLVNKAPQLLIAYERARDKVPTHIIPLDILQRNYGVYYNIENISRRLIRPDLIESGYMLTAK